MEILISAKMNFQNVVRLLESNTFNQLEETRNLLIKIADNILKYPVNVKYTILKKSNKVVSKKILPLKGGKDALLLMGFMENDTEFIFPTAPSNGMAGTKIMHEYLKNIHKKLQDWIPNSRKGCATESEEKSKIRGSEHTLDVDTLIAKPIVIEPFIPKYKNPFLVRMSLYFHQAQLYGNDELKENARKRIPIYKLEINAQKRKRVMQKLAKEGKTVDPSMSVDDLLLLELLCWFKEEFFTWMNQPDCVECGEATKFSHYSSDKNLMQYTKKVEIYICEKCWHMVPFPRYNDLNILLESRSGRCGEWANVFTLMCHAMGWEARLVMDETDHVWTEVYSHFQRRWIHCDPCENVCDTPLMYENGWGKSLSYVIAYSPDELQDVTWRYSSHHKELLKRRTQCTEEELIAAIIELRNERLDKFTQAKKNYILRRCVVELAELLIERTPKDDETRGRTSGALGWRLARGETTETAQSSFTFSITQCPFDSRTYTIKYCCASDRYVIGGFEYDSFNNWYRGVYKHTNMIRKQEHDWKQVYLCRNASTDTGYIAWKIMLDKSNRTVANVRLKMDRQVFENGVVDIKITGDDEVVLDLPANGHLNSNAFQGSESLLIEAHLSGGKGNEAWQHAQLFRQSMDSTDFSFELTITIL